LQHLWAGVKTELDGVKRFTERKFLLKIVGGEEKIFTQEDFPTNYITVGTLVYIANVSDWTIIEGLVTQVKFAHNWPRKYLYYVGSHANQGAKTVFRTRRGAMNYLRKMFAQSGIPATFDHKKVKVVKYISEAQHEQNTRERSSRIRASIRLPGL
jgi:hypothetical protein